MLKLWTDGSAIPNPGPGGFAVILQHEDGTGEPVILGREAWSSNIRMEGMAILAAIKGAKGRECRIYTDSRFWMDVLMKWAPMWEMQGWKKTKGKIMNLDIVKELYELYMKNPVKLVWVKGHAEVGLNELADEWADKAREGYRL